MLGELAALGTAFAFSIGSVFLTLAGRHIGPLVLNRLRLIVAIFLLSLTHWLTLGTLLPWDAEPQRWLWLGLSGVVGLVIGDIFLFQAFVWIGPRLSMLMMSLAPVIAALLAWVFLGERMALLEIVGVALTLGGVAWVVMERNSAEKELNPDYGRGVLYGLGAAAGQAGGLVLAKNGLGGTFSPVSANLIRMLAAAVVLWGLTFMQGQGRATLHALWTNPRGVRFALMGAFFGPFLGVSLSMLAIQSAEVGIASTLMSLTPVLLLPISYVVFKERYGWGAVVGTLLAIAGVAVLFLV